MFLAEIDLTSIEKKLVISDTETQSGVLYNPIHELRIF